MVLDLRVVFLGSSELFLARAVWFVRSLERGVGRSSVLLVARPEGLSFWLEREFLGSSEGFLCLVARATKSSLERGCFIAAGSSVFEHQLFALSF